jgi:hypothetical protein
MAPLLHIIVWCVEGVVNGGDDKHKPGDYSQDLVSPVEKTEVSNTVQVWDQAESMISRGRFSRRIGSLEHILRSELMNRIAKTNSEKKRTRSLGPGETRVLQRGSLLIPC